MREIEVKARVRDPAATLAALDRLGIVLGPTIKQHDVVYGPPGAVADAPGVNWLRIRTVDDSRKCIFTLKRPVTSKLDSIEHETVVDDVAELTAIVQCLGFERFSELTKVRRKATYGDIEICYDDVPGLGRYIEVEKKLPAGEADHATVEAELWELLDRLGVSRDDQETSGYDVLMQRLPST